MIGHTIKKIREQKNITQVELAERLNVSQMTICRWEDVGRVPASRHENIAKALDMHLADLYMAMHGLDPSDYRTGGAATCA